MRAVQINLAFSLVGCDADRDQTAVAFRDVGNSRDSEPAVQVPDFVRRSGQGINPPKNANCAYEPGVVGFVPLAGASGWY
jgi:hypothetical protein